MFRHLIFALLMVVSGFSVGPLLLAAEPAALSPYAQNKASRLLQEKMSCLGCHSLGGEGGRIAPDLLGVSGRLSADEVHRLIENPEQMRPGTMMPATRLSADRLELIVAFLTLQDLPQRAAQVEVPAQSTSAENETNSTAATLFARYCVACHGNSGKGDGVNAAFLAPPPTDLTDARQMSRRPDDSLFDIIAVGGRVFDLNHRMPAWGQTLKPEEIRLLVEHIRQLCRCQGPAWSRDGD